MPRKPSTGRVHIALTTWRAMRKHCPRLTVQRNWCRGAEHSCSIANCPRICQKPKQVYNEQERLV